MGPCGAVRCRRNDIIIRRQRLPDIRIVPYIGTADNDAALHSIHSFLCFFELADSDAENDRNDHIRQRVANNDIHIHQQPVDHKSCKGIDMEFTLMVDGKPYGDGKTVTSLNRVWVDDGAPKRTSTGNDLRPKQVECFIWTESLLADSNAVSGEAVLSMDAGEHTIALTNLRDALVIDYVQLKGAEALPSYREYSAAHSDVQTEAVQLVLQAENTLSKSASWRSRCIIR